ncbi:MAG: peptidoglycan DD-metalloendopeptidase family protein [Polyangiaceae bacterium]|nr:peptidoglycan DD-metalloendopeptidase family protein [Polyangiaceae bacterium]
MNTSWMTGPWILVIALTLVHFIWQGAVIYGVVRILLRWVETSPRLHYAVVNAGFVVAAILPVLTARIVWSTLPDQSEFSHSTEPVVTSWTAYLPAILVALWFVGAIVRIGKLWLGLHRAQRVLQKADALRLQLAERAFHIADRLGLSLVPRLFESAHINVPITMGWLRPVVVMPVSVITSLPPSQVDALLAHELAHVARYDFLVNLIQEVVTSALFFHPVVHFLAREARQMREHLADEAAARVTSPAELARALYTLESSRTAFTEQALGAHGGDLVKRVEKLLSTQSSSRTRVRTAFTFLTAGALLLSAVAGVGACGASGVSTPSALGPNAPTQVTIRWLPPVLAPYRGMFEAAAKKHGVDAELLAIVALVESAGDPDAKSPMGALGLMQIMPATGATIASEQGVKNFSPGTLFDPAVNVDFGAFYLAKQISTFAPAASADRQVAVASVGYNGGPKTALAYVEGRGGLSDETAHYQLMVSALYSERHNPTSSAFNAWRARVAARAAEKAVAPVERPRVTLRFGEAKDHSGVDLAAPNGTLVRSPWDGEVAAVEEDEKRGKVVVIKHRSGFETRYHHLGSTHVKVGEKVDRGAPVGTVGMSGVTSGPHVHFEVHDLGAPVDPAPFVAKP